MYRSRVAARGIHQDLLMSSRRDGADCGNDRRGLFSTLSGKDVTLLWTQAGYRLHFGSEVASIVSLSQATGDIGHRYTISKNSVSNHSASRGGVSERNVAQDGASALATINSADNNITRTCSSASFTFNSDQRILTSSHCTDKMPRSRIC